MLKFLLIIHFCFESVVAMLCHDWLGNAIRDTMVLQLEHSLHAEIHLIVRRLGHQIPWPPGRFRSSASFSLYYLSIKWHRSAPVIPLFAAVGSKQPMHQIAKTHKIFASTAATKMADKWVIGTATTPYLETLLPLSLAALTWLANAAIHLFNQHLSYRATLSQHHLSQHLLEVKSLLIWASQYYWLFWLLLLLKRMITMDEFQCIVKAILKILI